MAYGFQKIREVYRGTTAPFTGGAAVHIFPIDIWLSEDRYVKMRARYTLSVGTDPSHFSSGVVVPSIDIEDSPTVFPADVEPWNYFTLSSYSAGLGHICSQIIPRTNCSARTRYIPHCISPSFQTVHLLVLDTQLAQYVPMVSAAIGGLEISHEGLQFLDRSTRRPPHTPQLYPNVCAWSR